MRIMGLDVGDKRIGISLSDPLKITAQSLETLERSSLERDINYIANLIKEYEVTDVVVGLPKNMNGTLGPQAEKVKSFIDSLEKVEKVNIIYIDERLSTVTAEKTLIAGDVSRRKRKKVVDKLAATLILQSYLDRIN